MKWIFRKNDDSIYSMNNNVGTYGQLSHESIPPAIYDIEMKKTKLIVKAVFCCVPEEHK